jgi:hypothetical protein
MAAVHDSSTNLHSGAGCTGGTVLASPRPQPVAAGRRLRGAARRRCAARGAARARGVARRYLPSDARTCSARGTHTGRCYRTARPPAARRTSPRPQPVAAGRRLRGAARRRCAARGAARARGAAAIALFPKWRSWAALAARPQPPLPPEAAEASRQTASGLYRHSSTHELLLRRVFCRIC